MRAIVRKFFADRGTHLAAMIAYFALLSFVPLLFLSLALLGAVGQATPGSFFVRELHRTFPSTSLESILNAVRKIRDVLGPTDPSKAPPGSIRREFGSTIMFNAAHASDSPESAQREFGIVKPGENHFKQVIEEAYGKV